MSINLVMLSGNLTKDPELRSTQDGKAVCSFTIATNEGKDKVEFHNCVAWEKTAEVVSQYCFKGNRMAVTGRLQTRKWEKDGVTRYSTDIVVSNVDLPPKGSDESNTSRTPEPNEKTKSNPAKSDEFEDTIPW